MREVEAGLREHGWPLLPLQLYSYHYDLNTTTASLSPSDTKNIARETTMRAEEKTKVAAKKLREKSKKRWTVTGKKENKMHGKKSKVKAPNQQKSDDIKVLKLSPWMKTR